MAFLEDNSLAETAKDNGIYLQVDDTVDLIHENLGEADVNPWLYNTENCEDDEVFKCDEPSAFENLLKKYRGKIGEKKDKSRAGLQFKTPAEMNAQLSNVVGQENAKRVLCTAIWKKLKYGTSQKCNIMLVGPSGSGKTYLVQSIAKLLGLPIVIVDASTLTEAGYRGNDIENIFSQLLVAANNNVELAEQGIVVLDEIDKKGANDYLEFDSCGRGVQHNMLRMLEDGVINIPDKEVSMRTDNIMFVACGAFQKVEDIIKKRGLADKTKASGLNLVDSHESTECQSEEPSHLHITREDLLKHGGMIPEFIGRFDMVVNLEPLTEEDFLQMLKNEKTGVLKEYATLFELNGFELTMSDELLLQIVRDSVKKGLGARGLRAILDKLLLYPLYSAPSVQRERHDGLIKLELTSENICNGHFPFIQGVEYKKRLKSK